MKDNYAAYAQFYDQGTSTDISEKVDLIKKTIRRLNPAAKTVLEVACGTGNVLALMQPEYNVTGLDLSPVMLDIAKKRLEDVEFHVADMTSFKLEQKFDAIICVFDSVNHLLSFEDWESLFDRVKEHLKNGGVFIMDVNTIAKLDKLSTTPVFRVELEEGYQITKIVKSPDGIYHWKLENHVPQEGGVDKVIESNIPEVAFSINRIEGALRARFSGVETFTPDGSVADESASRIYFACNLSI